MTDLTARYPIAIMFSGGSDSLALLSMAYKGQLKGITPPTDIHLLYMLNGMSRFPSFPRERYRIAKELLESQITESNEKPEVHYMELDTARLFQGLWIDHYEELMPRHDNRNLVCVACKVAMHTRSIIYCVENQIDTFITGYAKKQEYYPEQTATFMNRLREFSQLFGVDTRYPVFEDFTDSTVVRHYLEDRGLPSAAGGERDCMFSQTYTTAEEHHTAAYLDDMLPVVSKYLDFTFKGDVKSATACFPPGRIKENLIKTS